MKRWHRDDRRGMTLLEVVLALGILAIGMASVLSLLSFGAALSTQAERRAGASAVLGAVLPTLEERLFPLEADGTVGEPAVFEDRPVPGHEGYTHSVRARRLEGGAPGTPELWRIDVAIHWRGAGGRRDLDFTTVFPRAVPFGERLRQSVLGGGASPAPASRPPSDAASAASQ